MFVGCELVSNVASERGICRWCHIRCGFLFPTVPNLIGFMTVVLDGIYSKKYFINYRVADVGTYNDNIGEAK